MNAYLPPSARRGFRIAALIAAVICVLVIAAGAFAVSYTGVRDMALTAGVTAHYARFYPWIFDAVFIVAAVAALSLRGALRAYAWLAILVILGAVAAADAIHAMSIALPKRPTEATVAAAPWAVLLIGFTLLYAMARQALPARRMAAAASSMPNGRPENGGQATQVPLSALLADKPATRPERAQAALTARAATATATKPDPPAESGSATKTEPLTAKTKPAVTDAEPVIQKTEPLTSKPEPAAAETKPAAPKAEPPAAETEPGATKSEPVSTDSTAAGPAPSEPVTARTDPTSTGPISGGSASTEPTSMGLVTGGTEPATPAPAPAQPPGPEPAASPADPYPARTQQFAVRRPPMAARSFTESDLPARQPAERDDPSDADAEPVEPTMHFNRLRSSPTPPGED